MNNKYINGHLVSFFVDQQHRTVGAVIKDAMFDAVDLVQDKYNVQFFDGTRRYDKFYMPMSMKATAKCSPEDTFDVSVGMDIAYKRLKKKYMRKYALCLRKMYLEVSAVQFKLYNDFAAASKMFQKINPLSIVGGEMPSKEPMYCVVRDDDPENSWS